MTKKQIWIIRIIYLSTLFALAMIFLWKGLDVYHLKGKWQQWIIIMTFVLIIFIGYIAYLVLQINLIYNRNLIFDKEKNKNLRYKLYTYLLIKSIFHIIFIIFVIMIKIDPTILFETNNQIDIAIFIVLLALSFLSLIVAWFNGFIKYKQKQKIIKEYQWKLKTQK